MIIELKEFPTHLPKTDNKVKANKMQKLNGQAIYNGALNRFGRAHVMNNMHEYLMNAFKPYEVALESHIKSLSPVIIIIEIHTVLNHGNISMRSGKMCWKPAKPDYDPTWDIYNLASIWIKGIEDSLSNSGIIPDDNVRYVRGGGYIFKEVNDLKDRKMIIRFK